MSSLPLPVRIAAGLAAEAVERARKLPQDVTEWPMTAVSQVLQLSMRVQQRMTELAIKGDEALAALREVEEDPPWAVFDEDLPGGTTDAEFANAPRGDAARTAAQAVEVADWFDSLDQVYEQRPETVDPGPAAADALTDAATPAADALDVDAATPAVDGGFPVDTEPVGSAGPAADPTSAGPNALPSYPELTLASVRARLRVLTAEDLEELLAYERRHYDRPEFVRMLTNRIAAVRAR